MNGSIVFSLVSLQIKGENARMQKNESIYNYMFYKKEINCEINCERICEIKCERKCERKWNAINQSMTDFFEKVKQ